jgi:repressor LexA
MARKKKHHDLSEAQADVLAAIEKWFRKHDYPPSVRDIAAASGRTVSTTYHILNRLESAGYIRREPMITRSLRLVR